MRAPGLPEVASQLLYNTDYEAWIGDSGFLVSVRLGCEHTFVSTIGRLPGGATANSLRLADAEGLSHDQAEWLSGLIDAEGHLAMVPNNGGSTWSCSMSLALREDDLGVVLSTRELTGLGHISKQPARNGSRPQIDWRITSKSDCRLLAECFSHHPLRGRKAAEARIWSEAVFLWASSRYGNRSAFESLSQLARTLKAERSYRPRTQSEEPQRETVDSLEPYFGGFFTGEGWFSVRERAVRFGVKVRRDDRPLLERFVETFGVGSIYDLKAQKTWSPSSVWIVLARGELRRSIEILDSAGIRGRKLRQYLAWRPAAAELARCDSTGATPDLDILAHAKEALLDASEYRPITWNPPTGDQRRRQALNAYRAVLREWAREEARPLSGGAYEQARVRHPSWPKRDTLAANFGSWRGAIEAAGLSDRIARCGRWP